MWRADCEPSMGYFMQRTHIEDQSTAAGAPAARVLNGAQLVQNVLDPAAAAGIVVYCIVPECSRICAADVNVLLRDCSRLVRWVFADLRVTAAAGVGYLPPGFLVAGTWLNTASRAVRAIFCLHVWAAYLLPRLIVRLQRTAPMWA